MKEKFLDKTFAKSSQELLKTISAILDAMAADGYTLTVRQLYYQLVSRDIIPNNIKSYKRIVGLAGDGRLTGLLDWWHIEDRNRKTVANQHWDNPGQVVQAAANSYYIDKRADQPCHIEVMVEKDALSGVLGPVCSRLDVPLTADKGYCSLSTLYSIGKRLKYRREAGKAIHILYLGDHDPSGIDMTRDLYERLTLFSAGKIEMHRIALNRSQIDRLHPPENPAKSTDSRFKKYVEKHGRASWELDAVDPHELDRLVTQAVTHFTDKAKWEAALAREKQGQAELQKFVAAYQKQAK